MVDLLYWSKSYLTTEKNEPIEFIQRPYLKELYLNWQTNQVIKKAGQMGISNYAIDKALWLAANYKVNIIYTLPTSNDVTTFSQSRVDPVILNMRLDIPRNVDNVKVKQINNSFLYFKGTFDEGQAISVPSDFNIHDEIDFSKQDIVEMYSERLSASLIKWKLKLSTPSLTDYGIDAEYKQSDQRKWFVTCPKCGFKQVLTENHIDVDNNRYACERCGGTLINTQGEWLATAKSSVTGYHITQLMAGWITPAEIVNKKKEYKFKRDYYNYALGETYDGGSETLSRIDFMNNTIYTSQFANNNLYRVGIDWGDDSYIVIKSGNDIVHYQTITGDTRTHVQQILNLISKFNNLTVVADFGYGDIKNNELADKLNAGLKPRFYKCIYTDSGMNSIPEVNDKEYTVKVDRTRSIEERIIEIKNGSTKILKLSEYDTFINHHLNIVEIKEKDKHGQVRIRYGNKGADHFAHANNYASVLSGQVNIMTSKEMVEAMGTPDDSEMSGDEDAYSMSKLDV